MRTHGSGAPPPADGARWDEVELRSVLERRVEAFFDARLDLVGADIRRRTRAWLLRIDEDRYVAGLAAHARADVELRFDAMVVEPFQEDVPAEWFPPSPRFAVERGRTYRMPAFRFRVPVVGEVALLRLLLDDGDPGAPRLSVAQGCLCVEIVCFEHTTEQVNADFARTKHTLGCALTELRALVRAHNVEVEDQLRQRVWFRLRSLGGTAER